jgi:hypothetical protein
LRSRGFLTALGTGVLQAQVPTPTPATPPAAAAPAAAPPAASAAATVPITNADIKNVSVPKPEDKAKGDPAGTITGTAADIPVGDMKKGLTIDDVVDWPARRTPTTR